MSVGNVIVSQDAPAKNNLWIQPKGTARFWNGSIWKTISGSGGGESGNIDWSSLITYDGDSTHIINSMYLPAIYLPLTGGVMTGPLQWEGSTALPQATSIDYFLGVDAFTSGGTTKWISAENTIKSLIGTSAIGTQYSPLYWTGSAFSPITYTLSSTVNAGTANYLAYYSETNAISSTSNLVVSGNTINLPQINNVALNFRPNNDNYSGWIAYETGGNEAMVFGTKHTNTSFIFANTTSEANVSSTQWQSLTPALQIKQNCVYINSLIANGTTPSYNLYVNGTGCFTNNLYIDNTRGIRIGNNATPSVYKDVMKLDASNAFIIGYDMSPSGYNTYLDGYKIYFRTGTQHAARLYIDESGNVGIGNTSPNTKLHVSGNIYATGGVTALQAVSSDKRLKKNIKPFNATEIVDKLKPVQFEWNNKAKKYSDTFKDGKNYGLLAQDSDGIIDDLVFDLPDGKGYKGVRYEKLIPILLQAIKELKQEINDLKNK